MEYEIRHATKEEIELSKNVKPIMSGTFVVKITDKGIKTCIKDIYNGYSEAKKSNREGRGKSWKRK